MSNIYKTLIHTALIHEAKTIIDYFNLVQNVTFDRHTIYQNDKIVLIVSGIGKYNTNRSLSFIYEKYDINRAINIGICGCRDLTIELGSLFCIGKELSQIKTATLTTRDEVVTNKTELKTLLVDMEAKYFIENSKKYLEVKDIFVFKVVSDYLSEKIPNKTFVHTIIKKSISKWETFIS